MPDDKSKAKEDRKWVASQEEAHKVAAFAKEFGVPPSEAATIIKRYGPSRKKLNAHMAPERLAFMACLWKPLAGLIVWIHPPWRLGFPTSLLCPRMKSRAGPNAGCGSLSPLSGCDLDVWNARILIAVNSNSLFDFSRFILLQRKRCVSAFVAR